MKLEQILGIWQLTNKGRSIPVNYSRLCREIEKLDSEKVGFDTVRQLEEEGFISTLPNGKRKLTDLGLNTRIPLPTRPVITEKSTEQNWARFKRLCAYYADCVTQSEKTQEYLFESDLNTKYLLPSLPIDWLNEKKTITVKFSRTAIPAINRIKSRKEDSEDIYIGYPLSAFHDSRGEMAYSPILLFPVDIIFDIAHFGLTIRHDEIEINRTWLEYNVPHEDHKDVLTSICFSAGNKTGLLDAVTAVQYLTNRFRVDLDPDYLDYNVEHRSKGITNSAVLFVGNPLKFSKTLKKELQEICKQPPYILDQTALAYIFRDPPLENLYEDQTSILPFDFLSFPSNHEQHVALKQALNQPVSKVTGPPGTGKSQVAVNLIANLVFYGKSALFASKNHKAIHAIVERAESVSPELPLVQFCSTEDGATGARWTTQPIDTVIAKGDIIRRKKGILGDSQSLREFEDSLENIRDYETVLAAIDNARAKLQEIEAKYELILPKIPVSEKELTTEYRSNLEKQANCIGEQIENPTLLQKIIDFILMRKIKAQDAEKRLRKLLPNISASAKNSETFKNRVLRLCGDIADYLSIQDERLSLHWQPLAIEEDEITRLAKEMSFRSKHLHDIFLTNRTTALLEVPETIQQEIKAASNRIARQNLPFLAQVLPASSIEEAQDSFRQFLKLFPAWATTLLSLSKASPCVAGLFDRVIIDEASQCEIPPIVPALYRSRGVTVIGDPAQFPPVITLRETRHAHIRFTKHKLTDQSDERFDFLNHNAFDVVTVSPLMLRDHFRCHEDIAAYFNEEYYTNKLKIRTDSNRLKFPENMGFKRALVWKEISDSLNGEISAVKELLRDLKKNNYEGEIGVISPFRKVVDRLKPELYNYQPLLNIEKDINTANGFQGGERDLIILILGITSKLSKGQDWYAIAEENRYIYNVAVSRARACLIVVGDRDQARQSQSSALRNLAKDIEQRPQKSLSQSPGEEMLYQALYAKGLEPKQQYPLVGRYLDMALVEVKIDIEVDGEAYHLNKYGERKQDDTYRDLQVTSVGWRVCRFWFREIRDNLDDCVSRVQELIKELV
ncbi:MAG: DUF559 domain-containing protein [Deltaproteobacteria bacterium]|nr:DUF559 domain-containing protein [Deltaproteobacteria bacterium]